MESSYTYDCPPRHVKLDALSASHFTGKERDAESLLDYFGARYYSSSMGRFLSADWSSKPRAVPYSSLTNPQSLNLYGYVGNNPLSASDPDGHCCLGYPNPFIQYFNDPASFGRQVQNAGIGALKGLGQAAYSLGSLVSSGGNPAALATSLLNQPASLQYSNSTQAYEGTVITIIVSAATPEAFETEAATVGAEISNELATTVTRVIPGEYGRPPTLGPPGNSDVFVTAGGLLNGMTADQISTALTIEPSASGFNLFEFATPEGIASPISRTDPGFIGGGRTAGGLPEYTIPNGPIPPDASVTNVPPHPLG